MGALWCRHHLWLALSPNLILSIEFWLWVPSARVFFVSQVEDNLKPVFSKQMKEVCCGAERQGKVFGLSLEVKSK